MRRSKRRLEGLAQRIGALFQGLEDAAAIVIGYDYGEVFWTRLVFRDEQAIRVMQEGDIPHERHNSRGAPVGGIQRLRGQGNADGLRDGSIDAGCPARRVRIHAVERQAHHGGIAHRVRSTEHQGIVDGERIAHRGRHVQPGKSQFLILEGLAHGLPRHIGCAFADLHPLAARLTGDLDGGAKPGLFAALVGEVLGAREHHQFNIRIIHQR